MNIFHPPDFVRTYNSIIKLAQFWGWGKGTFYFALHENCVSCAHEYASRRPEISSQYLTRAEAEKLIDKIEYERASVGYLSFEVQPDGSALMRNLAVDPDYQGMGIGKELTNTIFDIKPKVTKITLLVHRANITAIGMYKHLGFVEAPVTPQKEFNPDPKFWMGLELYKKVAINWDKYGG